jgi:hypothetical protein
VFLELKKAYDGKLLHFKVGWFPKLNKLNIVELAQLDSLVMEEGCIANHSGVESNFLSRAKDVA